MTPLVTRASSANAKLFRPWGQDEGNAEERKESVQEVSWSLLSKRRRDGSLKKGNKDASKVKTSEGNCSEPSTPLVPVEASTSSRLSLPGVLPTDYSSYCGALPLGLHHPPSHLVQNPSMVHIPPQNLDPLLLAEMTESELERMGLVGCASAEFHGTVKKQRPKKYRCPHCQVAFSNNGQLKGHIRIHTGERPFQCDYEGCGKAFTRNEELTRHRRIHSGQRPFACSLCDKRFGRKDHLKKHARTHAPPTHFLQPDPRFLLTTPPYVLDPVGSQRVMEMAALSGFPYVYGY